jgi:hypothetical protein
MLSPHAITRESSQKPVSVYIGISTVCFDFFFFGLAFAQRSTCRVLVNLMLSLPYVCGFFFLGSFALGPQFHGRVVRIEAEAVYVLTNTLASNFIALSTRFSNLGSNEGTLATVAAASAGLIRLKVLRHMHKCRLGGLTPG